MTIIKSYNFTYMPQFPMNWPEDAKMLMLQQSKIQASSWSWHIENQELTSKKYFPGFPGKTS